MTSPARVTSAASCSAAIARIGELDQALGSAQATLDREVAAAKARAEALSAPLTEERDRLAAQIRTWCERHRARLTEGGKTKSIDFPAGRVSWRMGQPRLEVAAGEEAKVIARLEARDLTRFLKVTTSLKTRALLDEPEVVKSVRGLSILPATENFDVRPAALELADGPAAAGRG